MLKYKQIAFIQFMTKVSQDIVRKCADTKWIGYGNPNSSVWFLGAEEGGAEIWRVRNKAPISEKLLSSLALRSGFQKAMNFHEVWRSKYGLSKEELVQIVRRGNVWRYIAAFSSFRDNVDKKINADLLTQFIMNPNFGSHSQDYFICELLPLPKRGRDHFPTTYQHVWSSIEEYHREVAPKRMQIIAGELRVREKVKLLVSYDKEFTKLLLVKSKQYRSIPDADTKFPIYSIYLQGRTSPLTLLVTPFFGQGLSYGKVRQAAKTANQYLC